MPAQSPFPPGALVAAYLRDSGGNEQDLSIAQQEDHIRAWCAEHALTLSAVFIDIASPGSSVISREQFKAMIAHFHRPECKEAGVILWNYSRFSRDIDDAQFYKADLRRRGYIIYSINDTIPTGSDGRFFEAAIDWMNQRYLEDLSTYVKRGLHHILEQHGGLPGTPPRGFKRDPITIGTRRDGSPHVVSRWVPDPDMWDLCQLAWQMRAEGHSIDAIHAATHLFNSKNSYTTFFRNRLYLGELHFGNLIIPDYAPPMIAQSTWDIVQAIGARKLKNSPRGNPDHPRRIDSSYILSGLAFCQECGALLSGTSVAFKGGKVYSYYRCPNSNNLGRCTADRIPQEPLESAVIDTIQTYLLKPSTLAAMLSQDPDAETQKNYSRQLTVLRKKLTQIQTQLANLSDILASQGNAAQTRTILQKIAVLEGEETLLTGQLSALQLSKPRKRARLTPDQVADLSSRLSSILQSADIETRRGLLRALIARVDVVRDGHVLRGSVTYYENPD